MKRLGLALEWFVNVDHVPIIAGIRKGFFVDEGIELHVVEPVNHEAGMVLVSEDKLDMAITEPIHLACLIQLFLLFHYTFRPIKASSSSRGRASSHTPHTPALGHGERRL